MIKIRCLTPWKIIDYGEPIGEADTVDIDIYPTAKYVLCCQETPIENSPVNIFCDEATAELIRNDNNFTILHEEII